MTTRVRCQREGCGTIFELPDERLGRSTHCPACGGRMTARPLEVDEMLRRQQERITGGSGGPKDRLPFVVLVDNVRSLWNVGAIFRTADACGVRRIVLTGISGCPPRPEISKTALGAERAVAWDYRADPLLALRELRREGYRAVALENGPAAQPLDAFDWPERPCLVVGNEVAGVSGPLLEACELHARIPMYGVKSSLNVAVAFGIAAHRAAVSLFGRRAAEGAGR
jgi:tRNA G18 (ribose-2'-O)-methylase SpoU